MSQKNTFNTLTFMISVITSIVLSFAAIAGVVQYTNVLQPTINKGIEVFIADQQKQQEEAQAGQASEQEQLVQNVRPIDASDHVRGSENADISIIEYSDFECPYCKNNHPTISNLIEKYDGKVNAVFRHLPLDFHLPNAQDQAEGSECVAELGGTDAYLEFSDKIFERTKSNKGFPSENIQALAEEVGVEGAAFAACMDSDKHLAFIQQTSQEANAMGIQGTPANLIRNNKTGEVKFLGGAYPQEDFEAIINTFIAQ